MSNQKNQAKGVQGASIGKEQKENVKSLVPAVVTRPVAKVITQSAEELLAENKILKTKLARIPENFEERAKFYLLKRELVKKHSLINNHKAQLLDLANSLDHECEENDFESASFYLAISKKNGGYKDDESVKISNPIVIKEVVGFVISKLNDRLFDYQQQIEA